MKINTLPLNFVSCPKCDDVGIKVQTLDYQVSTHFNYKMKTICSCQKGASSSILRKYLDNCKTLKL
jgi:hypothetical protein